jgi:hypothetical protein
VHSHFCCSDPVSGRLTKSKDNPSARSDSEFTPRCARYFLLRVSYTGSLKISQSVMSKPIGRHHCGPVLHTAIRGNGTRRTGRRPRRLCFWHRLHAHRVARPRLPRDAANDRELVIVVALGQPEQNPLIGALIPAFYVDACVARQPVGSERLFNLMRLGSACVFGRSGVGAPAAPRQRRGGRPGCFLCFAPTQLVDRDEYVVDCLQCRKSDPTLACHVYGVANRFIELQRPAGLEILQ